MKTKSIILTKETIEKNKIKKQIQRIREENKELMKSIQYVKLMINSVNEDNKSKLLNSVYRIFADNKKVLSNENLPSTSELREIPLSDDEALALLLDLNLSKAGYMKLRKIAKLHNSNLFPSYEHIKKSKNECYPGDITTTEMGSEIGLQSLLDHTSKRLLESVEYDANFGNRDLELMVKWGCDGASGQGEYKQKFLSSSTATDSSVFMISMVPILLKNEVNTKVWENPQPSSTKYCRPINFEYIKESSEVITREVEKVNAQIGKIDSFKYGLSSLHAWIRFMECIIHIAYNISFKCWSARTDKQKELKQKKRIQEEFRQEMGLLIDFPKQGSGNSNDGNTARRFFQDSVKSSKITGIYYDLIKRFSIILQTLACGEYINIEKFKEYSRKTAELYVSLYPWYYMPASVHRILMHGSDIINNFSLPIGQLSEEAQEARNKDYKKIREFHTNTYDEINESVDYMKNNDTDKKINILSDITIMPSVGIKESSVKNELEPAIENLNESQKGFDKGILKNERNSNSLPLPENATNMFENTTNMFENTTLENSQLLIENAAIMTKTDDENNRLLIENNAITTKTDMEHTTPKNRQILTENAANIAKIEFGNTTPENKPLLRENIASLEKIDIPDGVPTPFKTLLHWPETPRTDIKKR
ncbi:unnamed protein product [Brassicogethes aeneus]|uniref:Uncharacterized protein n=1 Tax=Brassicogethes aeneus TaxID=1431903 RepID=A0A9P0B8M6_BRAAE|nr:unnamed protein product [Brassicogethes aeneus]